MNAVESLDVSVTFTYTGQGGGSAQSPPDGEPPALIPKIQGYEAEPTIEGGTEAYLAVNGPRKEVTPGWSPADVGERHQMTLTHDAGLVIYPSETAQDPLTVELWDDYDLGNWATRPTSVWVQATQPGQKLIHVGFSAQSNMGTVQEPDWGGGESDAKVTLNCVEGDLSVPDVPYTEEEEPGAYLGNTPDAEPLHGR